MSNYELDSNDIGLGEEDKDRVKSNKVDWYKVTDKGRVDRVSLVYFHARDVNVVSKAKKANPAMTVAEMKALGDATRLEVADKLGKPVDELTAVDLLDITEAKFKALDAGYRDNVGYTLLPKKIEPSEKAIWDKLEIKTYVATCLLVYPTDREGNLDRERLAKGWKLMPWRFSAEKYERFKAINKKLSEYGAASVSTVDLTLTCKDPKFQNVVIDDAGPALWQKNKDFQRLILTKALEIYPKLNPFKALTTEELREKLGMGGGGSSGGSDVSAEDFSSVLANVLPKGKDRRRGGSYGAASPSFYQ